MEQKIQITAFLTGEQIYLRDVRLSDVNENYYRWMNDPEVTKFTESRFYPVSKEALEEYIKEKQKDKDSIFLAIIYKENHKHIGNIKLGPINWIHRLADIGIIIGEKDYWEKGVRRRRYDSYRIMHLVPLIYTN